MNRTLLPLGRPGRLLLAAVLFTCPCGWEGGQALAVEPQVRCPDCDERGRMACPECDGRGHLEKACETCKGKGEKRCPVCTKKRNEAGAGRITCNLCRGEGTRASTGKTCQRCQGEGSSACFTCLGKAVRPCPPLIYAGRCATCRSARHIECRTCGGDKRVAESVRERRLRAKNSASIAKARRKKETAARARAKGSTTPNAASVAPVSKEGPPPSSEALEQRFEAINALHGEHFELFAVDPRPDFKPMEREALQLRKETEKLTPAVPARDRTPHREAIAALKHRFDRVRSFGRRWKALRELFEGELRTFRTLEDAWERRLDVLASTPNAHLARETERLNRRIDLALRLVEAKARTVEEEDPSWLGQEAIDLEKTWPSLKKDAEEHLSRVRDAAEEREQEAREQAAALATELEEAARKQEADLRRKRAEEKRRRLREAAQERRRREAARTAQARAKARKTPAATKAEPESATATEPTGWAGSPVLWAFAGFASAAGLFVILQRRRDRVAPPSETPSPPEPSHDRPRRPRAARSKSTARQRSPAGLAADDRRGRPAKRRAAPPSRRASQQQAPPRPQRPRPPAPDDDEETDVLDL